MDTQGYVRESVSRAAASGSPLVDLVSNNQTGETARLLRVELQCALRAATALGDAGAITVRAVEAAIRYDAKLRPTAQTVFA